MFIDWDDNGEFDIFDLGITLAIIEDEDDEVAGADFLFDVNGYYDEEGIWHDLDVEDD